jgi:nucleoside-diphosphate-sugar epimerase
MPYCVDQDPITYDQRAAEESWCHDIDDTGWIIHLMDKLRPDVVVHLAEINSIDPLMQVKAFKTNVGATAEVLYGCSRLNIRGVVGTWGMLEKQFSPTTTSMEMRRKLVGIYANGNAVINEVRMPIVLHPDFPSSSFRAFVNRAFNTTQLGQPFMLDQSETTTHTFRVCRVKKVVDAIIEIMQRRTREAFDVGNDATNNRASLERLISLALDVFKTESLTIYGRHDPIAVKASPPQRKEPKVLFNVHGMIKEEWGGFTF